MKDMSPARPGVLGWYCNCCNVRVRQRPRTRKAKQTMAKRAARNAREIYVRALGGLGRAIAAKMSGDPRGVEDLLSGATRDCLESESGESLASLVEKALSDAPNAASLIAEIEMLRFQTGRMPTEAEVESASKFSAFHYETEFGSLQSLADVLERARAGPGDQRGGRAEPIDDLMLPLLEAIKDGASHNLDALAAPVSESLGLGDAAVPGRAATYVRYGLGWARYLLENARLAETPGRNLIKITQRGVGVLGAKPARLGRADLRRFPEFEAFWQKSGNARRPTDAAGGRLGRDPAQNPRGFPDSEARLRARGAWADFESLLEWRAHVKSIFDDKLQLSLTSRFAETGRLEDVLAENPDLPEQTVLAHTRTGLRLPPDLAELENAGCLHPDPDVSLDIALFSTDRCGWRPGGGSADGEASARLAVAISDLLASNPILSQRLKPERRRAPQQNPADTPIAVAVWIAVASLHAERGMGESFTSQDILEEILRQGLTRAARHSVSAYVCNLCVANVPGAQGCHRKTYRVDRGKYRLYKKGDYYHASRQDMRMAPLPAEMPDEYKHLRSWYDDEYCRRRQP